MVTMADVARLAGVSATTVSHVINETRRVEPATEQAVRAAIEQTGYFHDSIGRSLRTGTTNTIGLSMSAMSNPYFGTVVHAIERHISEADYSLLLVDTHDDPVHERRAIEALLSHRVDGMIVALSGDSQPTINMLTRRRIPVVMIDRIPQEPQAGVDAIGVVNEEPTAQLVDHLASIGHTRIAMVTSDPLLTTTVERLDGYWSGIERNGLKRDADLVQVGVLGGEDIAAHAVEQLLSLTDPPTGIVMGNNQVTIGAMTALRNRGLEVPRDIAVVAFDDFPWADIFHPRLTAVSQPVDELGSGAVTMLLERLGDRDLPPRHQRLMPTIQHRESCGCSPQN